MELESQEQDYQCKMLEKNQIQPLLPMTVRSMNGKKYLYYETTGMQSLYERHQIQKISWQCIIAICDSLKILNKRMESYLLDLDSVFLHKEYIYLDPMEKEVRFLYQPQAHRDFSAMLQELVEYLLENFDHQVEQDKLTLFYDLYQNVVNRQYNLSCLLQKQEDDQRIRAGQREKETIQENQLQQREKNQAAGILTEPGGYAEPEKRSESWREMPEIKMEKEGEPLLNSREESSDRGILLTGLTVIVAVCLLCYAAAPVKARTVYLAGAAVILAVLLLWISFQIFKISQKPTAGNLEQRDGAGNEDGTDDSVRGQVCKNTPAIADKTELLAWGRKDSRQLYLMRKSGEKIKIDRFPFMVGSKKKDCDYLLENRYVSRKHACFSYEQDCFWVEDKNSTNGTYINKIKMKKGEKKPLCDKDVVKLAVEELQVSILENNDCDNVFNTLL